MNTLRTHHAISRGYVTIIVAALIGLSPSALRAQAKPAVKAKPSAPQIKVAKPPVPVTPQAKQPVVKQPVVKQPVVKQPEVKQPEVKQPVVKQPEVKNPPEPRKPEPRPPDVHRKGMDITHGPDGSRTIVMERPDHSKVVSNRYGHGYIQRPYMYHGAEFVHRTYYVNGVAYSRVYRPYFWHGVAMNVYAPGFYYAPAFYGWARNPWVAPIAFRWGWAGNPWYGYYGGYFTPYSRVYRPYVLHGVAMNVYAPGFLYAPAFYGWAYNPWAAPITFGWGWTGDLWYEYYGSYFAPSPTYASPSLWLTDYLLAQTLQAAYQARPAELANAQANFTPMTPYVKQQIADEVRRQIALENSEAAAGAQTGPDPGSSGIARMLSDNTAHVFVVSAGLNVQLVPWRDGVWVASSRGPGHWVFGRVSYMECPITEGDVLSLIPGTGPNAYRPTLVVLASKGQDCRIGATVVVGIGELQEMQNHMREILDLGLAELQKQQGQNGIPAAPAAAAAPPVQTAYAAVAPPPDPNVASELSAQTKEADHAEQEALQAEQKALQARRASLMGQTPDEVIAILGQPRNIVDTTAKKIYVFKDLKVTFTNGKASAVQ
jgi:hypothetical protein